MGAWPVLFSYNDRMPAKGSKLSPEARKAIGEAVRARFAAEKRGERPPSKAGQHMREPEHRVRASEAMAVQAKEWAEAKRGKPRTDLSAEARASMSAKTTARFKGTKRSEEAKAKTRESMKLRWKDPIYLAKMEARKNGLQNTQSSLEADAQKRIPTEWKFCGAATLNNGKPNKDFKKFGSPINADFVNPKIKAILMVDGCYWHGCPTCCPNGKFAHKPAFDLRMTEKAEVLGWKVIRVWEHDIHNIEKILKENLEKP